MDDLLAHQLRADRALVQARVDGVAGVNFIMGVPGADDVMLGYQSTSFHDALYLRDVLGLKASPEFEDWLARMGVTDAAGRLASGDPMLPALPALAALYE